LARFPRAGPKAKLKYERLRDVRFRVLSPPFNRWVVFYRVKEASVEVPRVLQGRQDWRERGEELF